MGRYPANYLIRRRLILHRQTFIAASCETTTTSDIINPLELLCRCEGQIAALRTRAPGIFLPPDLYVKHAASVRLSRDQTPLMFFFNVETSTNRL